ERREHRAELVGASHRKLPSLNQCVKRIETRVMLSTDESPGRVGPATSTDVPPNRLRKDDGRFMPRSGCHTESSRRNNVLSRCLDRLAMRASFAQESLGCM